MLAGVVASVAIFVLRSMASESGSLSGGGAVRLTVLKKFLAWPKLFSRASRASPRAPVAMLLLRVKESESSQSGLPSSVMSGPLELFSINHLSEPRKPQRSRKRWPKLTQSFSTRAMKPSMVRKYGSRQICARLLSCEVLSQPSEQ